MTIEDIKSATSLSNSGIAKETTVEKEKIIPVVKGKATVKKKNVLEKASDTFLAQDFKTVGATVLSDVIIPSLKDGIVECVKTGIEMLIYGEARPRKSGVNTVLSGIGRTSYDKYFGSKSSGLKASSIVDKQHSLNDIIEYETFQDAEEVKEHMIDYLATYNFVSVADYKDFSQVDEYSWTDHNWGWRDLSTAYVQRIGKDRYIIKLPKIVPYK